MLNRRADQAGQKCLPLGRWGITHDQLHLPTGTKDIDAGLARLPQAGSGGAQEPDNFSHNI